MNFSEKLVYARKAKGLTQAAVAKALDVTPTCLYGWEKGKAEPQVDMIKKICRILEIDPNWLIGLEDADDERDPAEVYLVTSYRSLSRQGQEYIIQTMQMTLSTYKKDSDADRGNDPGVAEKRG